MTPVDPLDAEKTLELVFLYLFRIAFTSPLLKADSCFFYRTNLYTDDVPLSSTVVPNETIVLEQM